jgi:hypothetical protein
MQQPLGQTIKFRLFPVQGWFSLGPGWAAIAGALSSSYPSSGLTPLLQLVSLWLLVDPILGTLWDLAVQQRLWQRVVQAQLPPPPVHGFSLPYARPDSAGGHFVLSVRRYRLWWREIYWPEFGSQVTTFTLGALLALVMGAALQISIFWLVMLAIGLILLAGFSPADLSSAGGGRVQTLVQLVLPWLMGAFLWSNLNPFSLALIICYGVVYLGGLRMLGWHRQAELLFLGGQAAAIILLLGLRLLPGAATLSVLFAAQLLVYFQFDDPAEFLKKAQLYLILGLLAAGIAMGSLNN